MVCERVSLEKMMIVTVVSGDDYVFFLRAFLESVYAHNPITSILVFYNDLHESQLSLLQSAFPLVQYIECHHGDTESKKNRIGGKIRFFQESLKFADDGTPMLFIDCDTLVTGSLHSFFSLSWDMAITFKTRGYILNTGVVAAKHSKGLERFLSVWSDRTQQILANPVFDNHARKYYGAADQMSLAEIVTGGSSEKLRLGVTDESVYEFVANPLRISVEGTELNVKALPCTRFNQTECAEISNDTVVVHYKSGWHNILLRNMPFHRNRPESKCRAMWAYWQAVAKKANHRIATNFLGTIGQADVESNIPFLCTHKDRGILNSEVIAILSAVQRLGIRRIIESGRWHGHSTEVLARAVSGSSCQIVSIDYFRSEVSAACEERLRNYPYVKLSYGNGALTLPHLLLQSDEPTLILLDGPKGKLAVNLMRRLFSLSAAPVVGFIHDCYLGSEAREHLLQNFEGVEFTDLPSFLEQTVKLDNHNEVAAVHPTKYHGIPSQSRLPMSYGPTLAMILRDRPASQNGKIKYFILRVSFCFLYWFGVLDGKLHQMLYRYRRTSPG